MIPTKRKPSRIPTLHVVMIQVGAAVLVFSMIAYFFAPPTKESAFGTLMTLSFGFLSGKFTNGFKVAPRSDEEKKEDEEE